MEHRNKAWITTSSEMGLAPHGAAGAAAAAAAGTAALALHGCDAMEAWRWTTVALCHYACLSSHRAS
jgi:hypothetical protein